jgi:DNA repair exonuclease SbcCD ATPase subunit
MIHFKKLIIKNFQSHVHTEFDFHPGLNVFVGPSDSGKSAILRALRWVLFNSPRGTDYIRVGANVCEVELHLNDGTIIKRIRNHHSINRYQLEKVGEEALIFEGFGSEVPLEIANAHQFKPLQLEQKDIYLQVGHQLEGPFLLSDSSGVKAKTIGLVSGAHLIDRALKKLNSDRTQLTSKNKYLQQQMQNVEQKLLPYENLDELEISLIKSEKKATEIKEKQALLIQLRQLDHKYMMNVQEQQQQFAILEQFPNLKEAELECTSLENKLLYLRQYRLLSTRYQIHTKEKEEQQAVYDRTAKIGQAEELHAMAHGKLQKIYQYKQLQMNYRNNQQEQAIYQHTIDQTKFLDRGMQAIYQLEQSKKRLELLTIKHQEWLDTAVGKKKTEQFLANNQRLLSIMEQYLPEAESRLQLLTRLKKYLLELTDKRERIAKGYQWLAEVNENMHQLVVEYGDLLTEHGECPICGSEINDHFIQNLVQELEGGSKYAAAGRED